jgi:hypothetical protein
MEAAAVAEPKALLLPEDREAREARTLFGQVLFLVQDI